jgi:hypothetical protein
MSHILAENSYNGWINIDAGYLYFGPGSIFDAADGSRPTASPCPFMAEAVEQLLIVSLLKL